MSRRRSNGHSEYRTNRVRQDAEFEALCKTPEQRNWAANRKRLLRIPFKLAHWPYLGFAFLLSTAQRFVDRFEVWTLMSIPHGHFRGRDRGVSLARRYNSRLNYQGLPIVGGRPAEAVDFRLLPTDGTAAWLTASASDALFSRSRGKVRVDRQEDFYVIRVGDRPQYRIPATEWPWVRIDSEYVAEVGDQFATLDHEIVCEIAGPLSGSARNRDVLKINQRPQDLTALNVAQEVILEHAEAYIEDWRPHLPEEVYQHPPRVTAAEDWAPRPWVAIPKSDFDYRFFGGYIAESAEGRQNLLAAISKGFPIVAETTGRFAGATPHRTVKDLLDIRIELTEEQVQAVTQRGQAAALFDYSDLPTDDGELSSRLVPQMLAARHEFDELQANKLVADAHQAVLERIGKVGGFEEVRHDQPVFVQHVPSTFFPYVQGEREHEGKFVSGDEVFEGQTVLGLAMTPCDLTWEQLHSQLGQAAYWYRHQNLLRHAVKPGQFGWEGPEWLFPLQMLSGNLNPDWKIMYDTEALRRTSRRMSAVDARGEEITVCVPSPMKVEHPDALPTKLGGIQYDLRIFDPRFSLEPLSDEDLRPKAKSVEGGQGRRQRRQPTQAA